MKTISVSVSEHDYEAFRRASTEQGRSIAQLIREAMAIYRAQQLGSAPRLTSLPVFVGHRSCGPLPDRHRVYEEQFDEDAH